MASEFNERQFARMLDLIDEFNAGRVRLSDLAFGLEGLLNVLEGVSEPWKREFLHEWGKIEDARADLQYRGIEQIDADTERRVRDAGERIKNLLDRDQA